MSEPTEQPAAPILENTPVPSETVTATPEPVVETPAIVPPAKDPKKPDRHGMALAKIAQKDREIRQREEAIKKDLAQLQDLQSLPKLAKENPIAFLQKMGISYEELTQSILQGTDPIEDLNAKYQALKTQQEAATAEKEKRETELKEKVTHNQRMVQAEMKIEEIRKELKNNPSLYVIVLVKEDEGFDDIVNVTAQHLQDTGRMLSAKEACDLVENFYEKEAALLFKASKIKKKYQGSLEPPKPSEKTPISSTPGKTITNQSSSITREAKPSTEEERLQRALSIWNKRNK